MSSLPVAQYQPAPSFGNEIVPHVNVAPPGAGGLIVFGVFIALLAGVGGYVWTVESEHVASFVLLGIAALCLFGLIALTVRRSGMRFSAVMYEKGFSLIQGKRTTSFRFDELQVLTLEEKTRLSNGRSVGFDRRLTARSIDDKASVRHQVSSVDPLALFVKVLLQRAAESASKRNSLKGAGWEMDSRGITNAGGTTRFEDIADSNVYDNELRIWRRGEEAPFLSVPLASDNAYVLARVVSMRETASEGKRAIAPGTMGRHLFDRSANKLFGVILLFPAMAIGSLTFLLRSGQTPEETMIAIGMSLFGALALAGAVYIFTMKIRFYEQGIAKKSMFGAKEYRFETIEKMSWTAIRQYVNGAYAGTSLAVRIISGDQSKALKFSLTIKGEDEDLDRARETLAAHVATKMEQRITTQGRAEWGNAWLTTEGVEAKVGFFGKETRRVSYAQPVNLTMTNGQLHLLVSGEKKPFATLQAGSMNFFPGLIVFQERVAKTKQ